MCDVSDAEFVAHVRQKLAELQQDAHALNQIWGASAHRFQSNPPISEQHLADLERKHGVELPSDYRSYLLEVGDGGAGPWQGLLPIRHAISQSLSECPGCMRRPFLHGAVRLGLDGVRRKWFQFRQPERRGYLPVSLETAMSPEFMAGTLMIAWGKPKAGSSTSYRLVLNGPERGRVWRDERARSGTVGPCESASWGVADPTFQAWMTAWTEQCELGHQFGL